MAMATLLWLLLDPLVALFDATGDSLALLTLFCGPLALAFFFNGALFVSNAAFNNMGRPFWSTAINWGRHTLGTIPFVAAGAWAFGAPGVLIGQAVGGVLFAGLSIWMATRLISGHVAAGDGAPEPERGFARQLRLFQLLHRHR
jgi:Na+-driven multidrug efflux pump